MISMAPYGFSQDKIEKQCKLLFMVPEKHHSVALEV